MHYIVIYYTVYIVYVHANTAQLHKCVHKQTHPPICSSRHGPVYQAVRSATLLLVVRFSPDRPLVGM